MLVLFSTPRAGYDARRLSGKPPCGTTSKHLIPSCASYTGLHLFHHIRILSRARPSHFNVPSISRNPLGWARTYWLPDFLKHEYIARGFSLKVLYLRRRRLECVTSPSLFHVLVWSEIEAFFSFMLCCLKTGQNITPIPHLGAVAKKYHSAFPNHKYIPAPARCEGGFGAHPRHTLPTRRRRPSISDPVNWLAKKRVSRRTEGNCRTIFPIGNFANPWNSIRTNCPSVRRTGVSPGGGTGLRVSDLPSSMWKLGRVVRQ